MPSTDIVYTGRVTPGFQLASGLAVGRAERPSPFPDSTLRMQHPHFLARDFDMTEHVPKLVWATINVRLNDGRELVLDKPDWTLELVDWTTDSGGVEIPPETFSFTWCSLDHESGSYVGLLYTPHPETKPDTNGHDYRVLEVLTSRVEGLQYGDDVAVMCRMDALKAR